MIFIGLRSHLTLSKCHRYLGWYSTLSQHSRLEICRKTGTTTHSLAPGVGKPHQRDIIFNKKMCCRPEFQTVFTSADECKAEAIGQLPQFLLEHQWSLLSCPQSATFLMWHPQDYFQCLLGGTRGWCESLMAYLSGISTCIISWNVGLRKGQDFEP